jgi:hypothetical protein
MNLNLSKLLVINIQGVYMTIEERIRECQQAIEKLENKRILDVKFKPYNRNCWRLYLTTDKGKLVMTFCKDWECPVIEYRH